MFGFARGESKRAPELTADEQEVTERVALAVNVLNAAEAPVRKEFLLAVGGGDEFDAVTSAWHSLTGLLLFNVEKGDPEFSTHHPLWSELYLSHHLEECGASDATDVFESVVNDLFGVIDDEALREAIRRELRKDTRLLKLIERKPKAFTRQFVGGVFGIGEDRPEIQPLYGTSVYSGIELPSAGGARVAVGAAFRRATMFNSRGKSTREREELDWAWKRAVEAGIDDGLIAAKYHTRRGHYARQQGEFETAREHYEQAREAAPGDEESQHEATSLNNLGVVARNLGEYERAREYHEESLEIGDRTGEATSLDNLGNVAGEQEDYETAEHRHQEALAISEELGDRSGVADQQYNIGVDANRQGELERALEWFQKSRATYADLGVDHQVLDCLASISHIAARLGHTETASEAYTDAIELIERSDLDRLAEQAREFRVRRARLDETPQGTLALYSHALGHVLEGEVGTATRLSRETWARRDTHDEDRPVFATTLAAGVGFAAHLTLAAAADGIDPDDDETPDPDDERIDEILSSVDPATTSLSDAVRAVYDHLAGDDPDHTAEELHDRVDSLSADAELDQLETVVFASLLSAFTSDDLADYSTTELYRRALVEALDEDRDVGWMMDLLQRVWERRDDHDSGTDAHAAATAAGILAGVFATGADDTALFVGAETVVQLVDPAATPLSDAARTAYDHLAGDEPGHTVEELRDQIDPPFSDPAVEPLETAVFATVLSSFTNDNTVPTVERYRDTLTDIARGDTDTQTALTELHRVWTQRDDHEPDTDAHAAATAAGVALAAYAELVPDQTDAVVDDPDALPPRGPGDSSRATLPDAVRAVCDHLAGDGPDHTATELKARVDTDTPSGTDAETVVFARLLAALS